jgi:hypothetical protein
VLDEMFEPSQLIVEFGTGLRIAIGQIHTSHYHPINCGLQIPAMVILLIAR